MNVKLRYNTEFLAGIYYEDRLQLNAYSLCIDFLTQSMDSRCTNVAMDRVKHFIHGVLEHTVFVDQSQKDTIATLKNLGVNVTALPEQPIDQIVGLMLFYKLNAIMEQQMVITSLDISSVLGDSIWYTHDLSDAAGPFEQSGWWLLSNTQHDSDPRQTVSAKVVKVISRGWHEIGLEWPDSETTPTANTVVYGNFPKKNED